MKQKFVIRPYKLASKGAKLLAQAMSQILGYHVRRVSTQYIPRRNEVVINWGNNNSYWSEDCDSNLNPKTATNKLQAFQKFKEHGVSHPEWTTDKDVALGWYFSNVPFLARTTVTGNSGQGIVLYDSKPEDYEKFSGDVVGAPLYVKYKKKKKEFRAHVVHGKVIEVVEKRKKKGYENVDSKIRNHGNGWVFCRDNVVVPDDLCMVACSAVSSLGLDFGAVDLVWNEKQNTTYALEVNSAPGIEGTTVIQYATAFIAEQN